MRCVWFQISIPKPSNACFGFDDTTGWTFFDLNALHDEFRDEPYTVVEADFVSVSFVLLAGSICDSHMVHVY